MAQEAPQRPSPNIRAHIHTEGVHWEYRASPRLLWARALQTHQLRLHVRHEEGLETGTPTLTSQLMWAHVGPTQTPQHNYRVCLGLLWGAMDLPFSPCPPLTPSRGILLLRYTFTTDSTAVSGWCCIETTALMPPLCLSTPLLTLPSFPLPSTLFLLCL